MAKKQKHVPRTNVMIDRDLSQIEANNIGQEGIKRIELRRREWDDLKPGLAEEAIDNSTDKLIILIKQDLGRNSLTFKSAETISSSVRNWDYICWCHKLELIIRQKETLSYTQS